MYRDKNESEKQVKIPLHSVKVTHKLSFRNINLKVDNHRGGQWFIHGPEHRKEIRLLRLKHPCWLSWL